MKKYKLKSPIVEAKLYEKGMEDGWRLYFSYENYCYEPNENTQMIFKSLEALEIKRMEMCSESDPRNSIIFEEPVPVIKTLSGIEDVYEDEYIVTDEKGGKRLINQTDFEDMFEAI